jgi:hypothetical protein
MYTVKGFLDSKGGGAVLLNAEDWKSAREKAKELRAQGMTVEIVHNDGNVIAEPEDGN